MSTIDIGIGHDNNLAITALGKVKLLANTITECCNHGTDFCIAVNAVKTCLLYVEDFTT